MTNRGTSAVWPAAGPGAHDDLDVWTTAVLSSEGLPSTPGVSDAPAPGWTEVIDGRGVFVRRNLVEPGEGPGSEPRGPDVWFIHGLAGSSTNWTALAGLLAERATGYSVDLPGHGRSDPPPRERYSLSDDADLVAELIRRRSVGPVHLVGNSLGGVVGTILAARHPDLVVTLTLISPAVPDLRLTTDRGADPRLALLLAPGTAGLAIRRLGATGPLARARGMGELCYGDPSRLSDSDYAVAAADLAWRMTLPWVHTATVGSLRALMRTYLQRRDTYSRLAALIQVPTLVIWGTRDRLVDVRLARRTADSFPRSTLLIIRGAGHTAQMEMPEPTASAILRLFQSSGAPHRGLTTAVATSKS